MVIAIKFLITHKNFYPVSHEFYIGDYPHICYLKYLKIVKESY